MAKTKTRTDAPPKEPLSPEQRNQLKIIWALLIYDGVLIDENAEWSYYGGGFVDREWDYSYAANEEEFRKKIKTVGIDFEKTDLPTYEYYSEFAGTGHESTKVEVYDGTIIFNDGTKQRIFSKDLQLKHQIDQFRSHISDLELVREIFGED